ncbi:AbrB/MazE/SpoVT family DNA-binding domain-containing protein [Longimonas halophila]|jgi:bifunctional DNA-binding transcriptional regulator/antitoxin component of YhaV-PrlF toxin-antitoxin module|uniref:AbrB/MazE/SpoVT family DNA-binding domain-containing protein n=1 Tax=Longimonas halophila TaxID=1469170 RepID=A0A2H3NJ35_9BACT|nr:AbrB/MazE/SpoVT family DNA-binding domain-containing protein [Longimonas halophila]PEN05523.1 AbrB/MazE/SpoVT family DNA-binding domain-containing protein [Longimonas halophila]
MAAKATTCRIDEEAKLTLPEEMMTRSRITKGDRVQIIETDQGLLITPYDPTLEEALELYKEGAESYNDALRDLA